MRTLAASLLAFALAGCATTSGRAGADVEAVRATLLRVDAEFSKSAQEQGLAEAFASYAAPDATMMPANQNPLTGREAIRNHFADAPPETTFVWKPFAAEVARSGALGYTLGTYELRHRGPDGQSIIRHGKYCSIWRKQPDGSWKWVVNIGNASPAPKGTEGGRR